MTGLGKGEDTGFEFGMREKKIVRVIGGQREDADTRTREWLSNRTQDADF